MGWAIFDSAWILTPYPGSSATTFFGCGMVEPKHVPLHMISAFYCYGLAVFVVKEFRAVRAVQGRASRAKGFESKKKLYVLHLKTEQVS